MYLFHRETFFVVVTVIQWNISKMKVTAMGKTKASLNILNMYELLTSGQRIRKNELAEKYGVDQRTVQRYIADLRAYFAEEHTRLRALGSR